MNRLTDRVRSWRWSWAATLALPPLGLLWQSLFWIGHVSPGVKAAYALLTVLSAVRPLYGLFVVAAIGPIADHALLLCAAPLARPTEAVVLAFLVGWLVRALVTREALLDSNDSLRAPLALFALTVTASLVVTAAAVQLTVGTVPAYVRLVTDILAHGYLEGGRFETRHWYDAALLVEGVLLVVAVLTLTKSRAGRQVSLARLMSIGVIAAASLSLVLVATWMLRVADPWAMLWKTLTSIRVSVHTTDLNAAGSHFVLVLPVLWAVAIATKRWRPIWLLAMLPIASALWLTGSRAAQFSILLSTAVWMVVSGGRHRRARAALVGCALVATIVAVIASRPGPESSVVATLRIRALFSQMSWQMWQSAPVFGVGIAEYFPRSELLMPTELRALYVAENAHNNFAQIGVELGVVGFGLFAWMCAAGWTDDSRH